MSIRKRPNANSNPITPAQPNAADSVGEAMPRMIVPTTRKMITPIGTTLAPSAPSFWPSV